MHLFLVALTAVQKTALFCVCVCVLCLCFVIHLSKKTKQNKTPQNIDIPFKKKCGHTVHLALVREDDLPAATWGVNGEGFLEALLNVWSPNPFRIILQRFVKSVPQLLTPTPRGGSWHPLCRRGEMMGRGPESSRWRAQSWRKGPWKKGWRL